VTGFCFVIKLYVIFLIYFSEFIIYIVSYFTFLNYTVAGPSSRLDDSGMMEYLDTIDSDTDFIPESDTDDTTEEEEDGPHAIPPAAHLVSDSEEDVNDEDYREILSPEQRSSFPIARTVWT
jgi:hypothetical protein